MKVLSVVGARPQFIKAAPVSAALRVRATEYLVHTGQHYDPAMSAVFFDELGLPAPDVNLGVGSGSHGAQTGAMLRELERTMIGQRPGCSWVHAGVCPAWRHLLALTSCSFSDMDGAWLSSPRSIA